MQKEPATKRPSAAKTLTKMIPKDFRQALTLTYLEDPCGVLPTPLWKMLVNLDQYQTSYTLEDGVVTHLRIQGQRRLMLCWHRQSAFSLMLDEDIRKIDYAMLHHSHIENFATGRFDHTPYFRLSHNLRDIPSYSQPTGFTLKSVNTETEAGLISEMILQGYAEILPTPDDVLSWVERPVFDPSLWIWAIDEKNNQPAGLGIAEFDPALREGSVEWVQILPGYRGLGLGKWLTTELLMRMRGRARFTTVCGQQHNDTRPDILYRKIGFGGDDIWWVLKRKEPNP